MKLDIANIYPTTVRYGVVESLTQQDFLKIQDAVENRLRNTEQMEEIHSDPGYTDEGLFTILEAPFSNIKDLFEKTALEMHEELYPNMKGKFSTYDIMCRGLIYGQTTHELVRCNAPWHYTGVLIAKSPEKLKHPEGAITFLDPRPYSGEVDRFQIDSHKGLLIIFPSWQRYIVNAIKSTNDTVVMLNMHVMFTHETNYKNKVQYVGPGYVAEGVDVLNLSDPEEGEVDIGRF
jgi:hypothetical protein